MNRLPALSLLTLTLLTAQQSPAATGWDCRQQADGTWDCDAGTTPPAAADAQTAPERSDAPVAADAQTAPERSSAPVTAPAETAAAADAQATAPAPVATPAAPAAAAATGGKPDRWALCPPIMPEAWTGVSPTAATTGIVDLEADTAAASADRVITLSGDAVIRYDDRQLQASDIIYRQDAGEVEASGGIRYAGPDLVASGESALLQTGAQRGTLRGITYALPRQHARGGASLLTLEGAGRLRLEQASYTTCAPGNRDWLLSAGEVDIDHNEGTVTARNARLTFKQVPILYTPYISYPLDDRRKSGLLFPKIGTTDQTGIDISVPWYWNIAPDRDATITPRIMSNRGTMLAGEFRFLTPHSNGTLNAEYLPSDSQFNNEDRRYVSLYHYANPQPRLETFIQAGDVSDPFYFGDLGSTLVASSQTSLERTAHAIWHGSGWNLGLTVQDFQNLDTTLASVDQPYRQLPQIVYELVPARRFLGLRSSVLAELNYFTHSDETLVNGTRLDIQPRLSLPLRRAGWYVEPALSVRHTRYALDNVGPGLDDSPTRTTPVYSLDAGSFFERNGSWGDKPYIQTLEPRLYYLYVPERSQNDLPVFDTGNYDFNFWTLFRDNRFNGPDRMGDANQLALALTSRFLDPASGRQLLGMSLGSLFYFRDRTVTLPGDTADLTSSSDIIGELSLALTRHWTARGEVLWNPHESRTERSNYHLQYRLDQRRLINLGYRFRDAIQEQTDVSFLWPLGQSWHLVGRWYYDLTASETIETLGGLGYERCCWGVQLLARNYINNDGSTRTNAVFLQLEFKGLGKLGTSVDDALERGILGYQAD
ncbi:MAG: LPS assembly protein LptD [Pseudomonadota bacterium]